MASRLFFDGRQISTPSTVSKVDDVGMSPQNAAVGNNLAIIGLSDGGQPGKLLKFQSPLDAERVLLGGEGVTAIRKAFAASSETGGPRSITFVRVGNPTASTLTLNDADGDAAIVLTSSLYGLPANQVKVKVEAGLDGGLSRKVTTQFGNDYFRNENLRRNLITVRYTGALAVGEIDVDNTQVVLRAGATSPGAVVATLPLASYPTIQQLADRIAAEPDFTAVADAKSALLASVNKMDGFVNADIKTADVVLTGNLQAVIDWMNSAGEGYVSAERASGAKATPAIVPFTYLSGGAAPAATNENWTDAIDLLELADVQWIVPLSDSAAVHSAVAAHCTLMSGAGRKERRAVVGGAAGLTVETVMPLARSIGSDRVAFAWPAHYDYDRAGDVVLLPGYMTAALIAGGFSGITPGTPMTNKSLRIIGLEYEPRNPVDTDDLIQAGICCIENSPRGYRVVRSVSTWLQNDNFNRVEMSCGAATDFTVRAVRDRLDVLAGQKANPRALGRAITITESVLRDLAQSEPVGLGVLVGNGTSPAYRNITASIQGDIMHVSFECSPVIPLNFITLTVAIQPYSGTMSAAGTSA